MNVRTLTLATTVGALSTLLLASPAVAQRGGPHGGGIGPQIDPATATTVSGTVVSFTAGAGQGTPRLVVSTSGGEKSFVLGPYRVLTAQGFAANAGDAVELLVYACASCSQGSAVGVVKNVTQGKTLTLRDAQGAPTWAGGRGGAGSGPGSCGAGAPSRGNGPGAGPNAVLCRRDGTACAGGPDVSRSVVWRGAVTAFSGGPGVGQPTVTLDTPGSKDVVVSPYRALVRADYVPQVGAKLEITAAPVVVDGVERWVALTLQDVATGLTIAFRDPSTGFPRRGR